MSNDKNPALKKRSGLGRGLGALLEEQETPIRVREEETPGAVNYNSVAEIPVAFIETNPFQPRTHFDQEALEELSESIKVQGIIQPITVRRLSDKQFQLISGERRLQASKLAGLTTIPAYIRTANDQQMLEMALIENIQRENLNALEVALSYQRLLSECDLKQEELGDRVGKKRTTVNNYLRLLKLPPVIQGAVRDNKLSMGHARALVNVEKVDNQLYIFNKTMDEDLSVRRVEDLVRQMAYKDLDEPESKPAKPVEQDAELVHLQNKLTSHFGNKVLLKNNKGNKGEIRIPYNSAGDLERILELINL